MTLPKEIGFEDIDIDGEVANEIIKRYNNYPRLEQMIKYIGLIHTKNTKQMQKLAQENKELKRDREGIIIQKNRQIIHLNEQYNQLRDTIKKVIKTHHGKSHKIEMHLVAQGLQSILDKVESK